MIATGPSDSISALSKLRPRTIGIRSREKYPSETKLKPACSVNRFSGIVINTRRKPPLRGVRVHTAVDSTHVCFERYRNNLALKLVGISPKKMGLTTPRRSRQIGRASCRERV